MPAQLGSAKSYILEVTGGTDSVGSAQYNYDLSQRRADAVVQYLAAKYDIAPHRFYLIGIGKDQYVADNNTADGRKQNRRVEVQLLSNMSSEQQAQRQPAASSGQASHPAGQVSSSAGSGIARSAVLLTVVVQGRRAGPERVCPFCFCGARVLRIAAHVLGADIVGFTCSARTCFWR